MDSGKESLNRVVFQKFAHLTANMLLNFLIFIASGSSFLIAYFNTQNTVFFLAYSCLTGFAMIYLFKTFRDFNNFNENVELFILNPNYQEPIKPIEINIPDSMDLSLKAAFLYAQDYGFYRIARKIKLNHENQAKREVIKGLRVLIAHYQEHEGRIICH